MKAPRIVIFAKAPIAGFAKTRLIPHLGIQGAAELALRMLQHTLDQALAANIGTVELCVTPTLAHTAWRSINIPTTVLCTEQGTGDLGARLARAAQRVIAAGESPLLIGTDCPQLNGLQLKTAAQALQTADATLIPTTDGGYALLGLNRFHSLLFTTIAWSTQQVAAQTLCRLAQLHFRVHTLPLLHDIDEPEDLQWLPTEWDHFK